jgi:hypothetical protein
VQHAHEEVILEHVLSRINVDLDVKRAFALDLPNQDVFVLDLHHVGLFILQVDVENDRFL